MSTFQGLEMAKKALSAQQGALYTTGHNISNVNTPGYSRQRVNFETTTPFPVPSRVQPQIAGQMGTGVEIGTVQRIRDQFLDMQFRAENSRLGYWESKQEALSRMEDLLNEPSENGLSKTMDRFWQSLQDLADHPENTGARSVVAQRGLALAETFNHLSKSLQSIEADLKEQIDVSVEDINSLLRQINNVNEQIQKIEPHGMLANDLYDERDRLIDQLSEHMNIKVDYTPSSESALDIAEGLVSIEILDSRGNSIGENEDKVFLLDATNPELFSDEVLEVNYNEDTDLLSNIAIGGITVDLDKIEFTGSFSALIDSFGYMDGDAEKGDYPEILAELDNMAQALADAFNEVHKDGAGLDTDADGNPIKSEIDFFVHKEGSDGITAETITINPDILKEPSLIAAGELEKGSRNGDNALKLADVFDEALEDLDDTSIRKFYTGLIGELGVKGQEAQKMKENTEILQAQVDHSRMSVSAVSLDEEISNLIKFQHAYNAAARNMTAIDELIDRIINQMGLVGR